MWSLHCCSESTLQDIALVGVSVRFNEHSGTFRSSQLQISTRPVHQLESTWQEFVAALEYKLAPKANGKKSEHYYKNVYHRDDDNILSPFIITGTIECIT